MTRVPRIKRNAEFQVIFRQGRTWSNAVAVLYLLRSQAPVSRIGVCVSKKLGKATVRNRVRRLIHESCRLRWPDVKDGWRIVILARRGALDRTFKDVDACVDDLLRRARLYRSSPPRPEKGVPATAEVGAPG